MNFDLLKPFILGQVRHAITMLGAYLVTSGYLGASDQQQFIGAGVALAGMAWSAIDKVLANRALTRAKDASVK